jgi:predicted transcriptional regulator of viral defense system
MEVFDEIARRQWGLLTHAQVLEFSSRIQLERMQKSKRLINVHRGIYRMAGAPVTWQQEIVAVLLALPNGVASCTTAARLHGLVVPKTAQVHVIMPTTSSHVRRAIQIHRSNLTDEETIVVQRITCTTVERTFIDMAAYLTRSQLQLALNEAVVAGKTTYVRVAEQLRQCGSGGRKGVRNLKHILRTKSLRC